MVSVDFILKQKHLSIVLDLEEEEEEELEEEEDEDKPPKAEEEEEEDDDVGCAGEALEEWAPSSLGDALPLPPAVAPGDEEEEAVRDCGREMPSCSAIST